MLETLFRGRALRDDAADDGENPAEAIYTAYKNAMFHTARDILGDDWSAEDAVMDALEKICAHPGGFEGLDERQRRRLVMRITENAAIDRWRRRTRRAKREVLAPADGQDDPDLEAEWPDGLSSGESAEDAYFLAEDFGSLEEAVRGLPARYREAVRLRYGEEIENREIARMLGIPVSTVSTRLERARAMLRKWLAEHGKGETQ
ncbi:MAG: sigma-70 family RNA polymerase sigma factor [Clostridia bacterium]|nr:sigma-70 family RNA polymerase sigma factor [Clostridia bacterium]